MFICPLTDMEGAGVISPFSFNSLSDRLNRITKIVCDVWGVTPDALKGHGRAKYLTDPRMCAYLLCEVLTSATQERIGQEFNRDHTTVCYGVCKAKKLCEEFDYFKENFLTCRQIFEET